MSNGETTEWVPVRVAAVRLAGSEEAIRRRIRAGEIPAVKAGRGARAPWLVDTSGLINAEHAALRERLDQAGVVHGRTGTPQADRAYADKVGHRHGDDWRRATLDHLTRRALLEQAAGVVEAAGANLEGQFADIDDEDAVEAEAQELARRVRRAERIRERAAEILDEDE